MPMHISPSRHTDAPNDTDGHPHDDMALRAEGLVHAYPAQAMPALAGVNLLIPAASATAVMGPSGSGKTTLLHCLAGIVRPRLGNVYWRERDITRLDDRERTRLRRRDFGFVFQSGMLLPELPAVENVALPLMLDGQHRRTATARAGELLDAVGMADFAQRRPGELSGGQAQRVAVARALVGRPAVVFADEPTGALDQETGAAVMDLLTGVTRHSGAALVVVTHNPSVAAWCPRIVTMWDGRIRHDSAASTTTPASAAASSLGAA